MKLARVNFTDGELYGWAFFCPGCGHDHVFKMAGVDPWTFNGDQNQPTFSPSLLNTCESHPDPKQRRCHLNLTAGKIHFHTDCTHDLVGQTVDLLDLPPHRD